MHLLFAVMAFSAVREEKPSYGEAHFWINLLKIIGSNWVIAFPMLKFTLKKEKSDNNVLKVLLGIIMALPILIIVVMLMMDADMVFRRIVSDFTQHFKFYDNFLSHVFVISVVFIYLTGYIYNIRYMKLSETMTKEYKPDQVISVTFLGLFNIVFLLFCIVQATYLFAGGYRELPDGIVYSEYARNGFFQLLFITIINFSIMLIFIRILPSCLDKFVIKVMLALLCFFTCVLIASSFYRMGLYIEAYGYTMLRQSVITFLVMESVLIAVTLAYICCKKIRTTKSFDLFKVYCYIMLAFYIIVNVSASNFVTSKLNIERFKNDTSIRIDVEEMGIDSIGMLIDLYESDISVTRKEIIANRINSVYKNLPTEKRWQNFSFIKSLSVKKVEESQILAMPKN